MIEPINLLNPDKGALLKKWEKELAIVAPLNKWDLPAELAWWAEYATRCHDILELGAYNGASTKIMLLANPELNVYVIDLWQDPGTKETFMDATKDFIAERRLEISQDTTENGMRHLLQFGNRFDGLLIDAGHTKELVLNDISLGMQLMKPGTLICGHDFHEPWEDNGVSQAVKELLPGYIEPIESIWAYRLP